MKNLTLQNWLEKDCNCHGVSPCKVTIDGQTWEACRYTQEREYTKEMDCVTRGERKAGDKYTEESIYCIGALPKKYGKRAQKVCFPFGVSDWYVACYIQNPQIKNFKSTGPEIEAKYHPFGQNFILKPWNIPGESIDKYERKPYLRLPMTISA